MRKFAQNISIFISESVIKIIYKLILKTESKENQQDLLLHAFYSLNFIVISYEVLYIPSYV